MLIFLCVWFRVLIFENQWELNISREEYLRRSFLLYLDWIIMDKRQGWKINISWWIFKIVQIDLPRILL